MIYSKRLKMFYHFKNEKEITIKDVSLYLKKNEGKVIKFTLYSEFCKLKKFVWDYKALKSKTNLSDDIIFNILTFNIVKF